MKDRYRGSAGVGRMEASPIRAVLDRATALRGEGRPVIPLSAGEPDFNTPETIKQATIRALTDNHTHYGSNRGLPELRRILSRKIKAETGVEYDPESEILITSGGAEAINNAILAHVDPGDEVIVFSPAFVSYKNLIKFCGGVVVSVALTAENGFDIDTAALERSITPKTRMIIINNPNNPTGAVYSSVTLETLADLAIKHDLLVVSDEIYGALVYEGAEFRSVVSFKGLRERSILISGFSKIYAMTGWRLGYIAADRRLCDSILRVHQYSTTCSTTFIQKGLADAMEDPATTIEVDNMLKRFAGRRRIILDELGKIPALSFVVPYGAFYVMADVSKTGLSGSEFASRLLEEKLVATVPAVGLGEHCGDFIRISYAASEEAITEGLAKIAEFVREQQL